MIQRIQSIFLLLVAVILVATLFMPIWTKVDPSAMEEVDMNSFKVVYYSVSEQGMRTVMATQDAHWIAVLLILGAAIALFSIFQYKNRLRQMQLASLNSLVMGGAFVLCYSYSTKANELLAPQQLGTFLTGFYLIGVALLFNLLANRFIRRDEKLVRSADRIR